MAQKDELKITTPIQAALERDTANQLLGRIQLADGLAKLVTVTGLMDLQKIKDDKSYKHLRIKTPDNKGVTVTTFKAFCEALGRSYEQVNEDLNNLRNFGADALESMQRAGLGYRDLRKLRKLPDDARETVIAGVEVNVGDKDEIVDLINALTDKHAEQKAEQIGEIKQLQAESKASDKVLSVQQESIKKLHIEIEGLKAVPVADVDVVAADWLKTMNNCVESVQIGGGEYATIGALRILMNQLFTEYEKDGQQPPAEVLQAVATGVRSLQANLDGILEDFNLYLHLDAVMNAGQEVFSPDMAGDMVEGEVIEGVVDSTDDWVADENVTPIKPH